MTDEKVKIGIALTLGLAAGGGIGGYLGYRLAEKKVRDQATEEVRKVQALYERLRAEDAEQARADWNPPTEDDSEPDSDGDVEEGPEPRLEAAQEVIRDLGYIASDDYQPGPRLNPAYIPPPEQQYPPDTGDEDFPEDIDDDLKKEAEYVRNIRIHNPNSDADPNDVTRWERDPNLPYVITEAEFREDRKDLEKVTLRYFAEDDTLCESDGTFIPDQNGTAGDINLHNYFGLASGDDNILHIRNERVMCDFEITRDLGSYQKEVLGFDVDP